VHFQRIVKDQFVAGIPDFDPVDSAVSYRLAKSILGVCERAAPNHIRELVALVVPYQE